MSTKSPEVPNHEDIVLSLTVGGWMSYGEKV